MHICFEYSPANIPSQSISEQTVSGREYSLSIHRRDATGPVYPHIWEQCDPKFYAFFAGRIAGDPTRDGFPKGHAVATRDVSLWTMDPEPDGSWIALKFDRESNTLSIAADVCLLQRWYYTQQGKSWFISNSLLYLKELLGGKLRVNDEAIPYMLIRGYLPQDLTPLTGVHVLQSGRSLTIEKESCLIKRRLEPVYFFSESPDLDLPTASTKIHEELKHAVAEEIASLDSVCIPLSGGIDSRFLLGCALNILPKNRIATLTFGHPNSLDFRIGSNLAKELGVRSILLPYDDRPVSELHEDNFKTAEGAYWCFPNHPVSGLRDILKEFPFVLSGYIGDLVFGSYDLTSAQAERLENSDDYLLELIHGLTDVVETEIVAELLANKETDPRKTDQACLNLQADTRENAFAMWLWEDHLFNRTNFAVELHRDLTFYTAPFVHRQILNLAYRLPKSARLEQRAYIEALRVGYPHLWRFPLKNSHGFSLQKKQPFQSLIARAFRNGMSRVDKILGGFTGKIYYHHPRNNYEHDRELMQARHRDDVLAALARVRELKSFSPAAMTGLMNRYRANKPVSKPLLQGLLTVDLWYQHYES